MFWWNQLFGSGSSISGWIPVRIRIQGFDDRKWKTIELIFCYLFWSKNAIYLSSKLQEKLQPSKENTQHINWNLLTFLYFYSSLLPSWIRIRIRWPDWIRIRNTGWNNIYWRFLLILYFVITIFVKTMKAPPRAAFGVIKHNSLFMCKQAKHIEFWPCSESVFGPTGSESISQRYDSGSGSFPFLIKVLRGLKDCLQNNILTQKFRTKLNFWLKIMCLRVCY